MKTLAYSFFLLFFCELAYSQADSTGFWKCGVQEISSDPFYIEPSKLAVVNVVVAFFDFPDGRLSDGSIPTEDWQLDPAYVTNPDAVFNSGYLSFDGVNFIRKARKLTFEQLWNIYFSENTYVTDDVHPDWMSHGRFGLPPTGDVARAWGSFKDYYSEVSYGNLIVQPHRTHTQYSGIYNFGIVNRIDEGPDGNTYVRPIRLSNEKLAYYQIPNRDGLIEQSNISSLMIDAQNRLQQAFQYGEIDFDPSIYEGKIIMVFAGGTYWIGGLASSNNAIIREKLTPNGFLPSNDPALRYSVINGVAIACHEFGHLIGWTHTHNGNYDIMNGMGKVMQNCPSHPNIIFKLQAGWISNDRIRKIRTISEVHNLPPVELNGDCAVVTVYGKPGYDDNWIHSEYLVIENRRMFPRDDMQVKFDKKLVWQPSIPPVPAGFDGGCLITQYTNYSSFIARTNEEPVKLRIINASSNRQWDLHYDEGCSKDFFGVLVAGDPPAVFDALNTNRTSSSFGLPTGISIFNISGNTDKTVNFNNSYSIEVPPDYSTVLYQGVIIPDPLVLQGNIFYTLSSVFNRIINIQQGSTVDFVNGSMISGPNSNIIAEGTAQNNITFRGCGYGPHRLEFRGLVVGNRPPLSQTPHTKITFCNFNNLSDSSGIIAATSAQSQDVPYIIENNLFDNANSKIRVISSSSNLLLQTIKGSNSNIDIQINANYYITVLDKIEVLPGYTLTFLANNSNSVMQFSDGAMLDINGGIIASRNSEAERIIFDKTSGGSRWGGIKITGGYGNFSYCEIKNADVSISIDNPSAGILVKNCIFENNVDFDIRISNFTRETIEPHLLSNNTFEESNFSTAIICSTGANINILNNSINGAMNYGINLNSVTNSRIIENLIYGGLNSTAGISSSSASGEISCNYVTDFENGIYLNHSSPKMYNNEMTGNSIGLFLVNGSQPLLAPIVSDSKTQLDGGYNRIHDNNSAEIKCSNPAGLPISLPVLADGYNSIYDEGIDDCLFDFQIVLPAEYIIRNNYWGINGPAGRICPSDQNVNYTPILIEPPSLYPCNESQNNKQSALYEKNLQGTGEVPNTFELYQNYPNPFNPSAKIKFDIPKESKVIIKVYDLLGRELRTLVNEVKQPGGYEVVFDASNLSSGVYFCRIEAGNYVNVKKMALMK